LWSLAYEWWYYCIFAFAAAGLLIRGWFRWALLACLPVLIVVLPGRLWLWMTMWMLGVGLYFVCVRLQRKPHPVLGTSVFLFALLASYLFRPTDGVSPEPIWESFLRDLGIALAYSFALLSFSGAKGELPGQRMHHRLASFSYSMYLFHFPFLLLMVATAERYWGWEVLSAPTPGVVLRVIGVTCVLYAMGYFFSMVSEQQTDAVKALLKKHVSKVGALASHA
jgi:peptidoglycan/LPS O-acetylase OafA/YrhL